MSKLVKILSKICQKFVKILSNFVKFYQFVKFCQNLSISSNFSRIFINFCIQYSIFQHFSKSTRFCKILQKILQNFAKILRISENFAKFSENCQNFGKNFQFFSRNFQNLLARRWFSCRFWKMLKNAYLDAKIGVDPAENEPPKEWLCRGRDSTAG